MTLSVVEVCGLARSQMLYDIGTTTNCADTLRLISYLAINRMMIKHSGNWMAQGKRVYAYFMKTSRLMWAE